MKTLLLSVVIEESCLSVASSVFRLGRLLVSKIEFDDNVEKCEHWRDLLFLSKGKFLE